MAKKRKIKAKVSSAAIPEIRAAIRTANPGERIALGKQLRGLQRTANAAALATKNAPEKPKAAAVNQ